MPRIFSRLRPERKGHTERPGTVGTLYLLDHATLGLTAKHEPEWNSYAGTIGVVSRRTRAPTADATETPQNACPEDSGLMMSGSPSVTLLL